MSQRDSMPSVAGTPEELSGLSANPLLWRALEVHGPGERCDAQCRALVQQFYKPLPQEPVRA